MDQALNKKILFFSLIFLFTSCAPKPEVQLVNILEEKYANLYVNNEKQKRKVISDLKSFLQNIKLNDENINEVRRRIHQLNDGHVVLYDKRKEKNITYTNGVQFFPGSSFIARCNDCSPVIADGKYEILEVDDLPLRKYLEQKNLDVAASTPWGRHYRVIHLLNLSKDKSVNSLKLKSASGEILLTKLNWQVFKEAPPLCVSGERLKNDIFKINILSLWCDDATAATPLSREQVYENFKKQFNVIISGINDDDKIIIDIREDGGGGDKEVEYVLNAFNEKSIYMYRYKYLRKTHPGTKKILDKLWPFKTQLWSIDEYDYTNLAHRPAKTFFNNKVAVLISAGCFSSCETIASALKLENRAVVIGSRTHGGSGDPVIFPIKETPYSINLPTCVNWQKNGELYEGIGVLPDQELDQDPSIKSDNVLARAIDQVQ